MHIYNANEDCIGVSTQFDPIKKVNLDFYSNGEPAMVNGTKLTIDEAKLLIEKMQYAIKYLET
jgi:hypothetical protein